MATIKDMIAREESRVRTRNVIIDASAGALAARQFVNPQFQRENQFDSPLELLQDHLGPAYIDGPHFHLINEHLVALANREITALAISTPPQHGKSALVSNAFPAWYFGRFPNHSVIGTAYNTKYAVDRVGRPTRDLIEDRSEELGISVNRFNRDAESWALNEGGELAAMGLDAGITGRRAHLVFSDDPIKNPQDAASPTKKKRLVDNWIQGCETRLSPDGIRLIVATRWVKDDLIGWVIENQPGEWTVLNLPALCDDPKNDPLGRKMGEALWPQYFDAETLKRRRSSAGPYTWSTMYQGKPRARPPTTQALIPYGFCESAQVVEFVLRKNSPIDIGLDVARVSHGDRVCLAAVQTDGDGADEWRKTKLLELEVKPGQNTMTTVGDAIAMVVKHGARSLRIDDGAMGGGVVDRLWQIQDKPIGHGENQCPPALKRCDIIGVSFGETPFDTDNYADIRTEMWANVSLLMKSDRMKIFADEELVNDLSGPQMLRSDKGKHKLESKSSMLRRGIRSTDLGDAVALAAYPLDWFERTEIY